MTKLGNLTERLGLAALAGLMLVAPALANIIYVDNDAPPGGNGTTWPTAYASVQTALGSALSGDEIRIAGGRYTPAAKTQSFVLRSGAQVYGGYAGLANPTDPDAREIVTYETILSGDLLGNDDPNNLFVNRGDNCYHVVTASGTDSQTRLDGVTIEGGFAVAGTGEPGGGGILMLDGSATFASCTIRRNATLEDGEWFTPPEGCGGGVCAVGGAPVFTGCQIHHNMTGDPPATRGPGEIRWIGDGGHGGGLWFGASTPSLVYCVIEYNQTGRGRDGQGLDGSAGGNGGGLCVVDGSAVNLARCTLNNNIAGDGGVGADEACSGGPGGLGGAVYVHESNGTLDDCDFAANRAGSGGRAGSGASPDSGGFGGTAGSGGAIYCSAGGLSLTGCTFASNTAGEGGGCTRRYRHCAAGGEGGGVCVRLGTLSMTDCDFTENNAGRGGNSDYGANPGAVGGRGGHGGGVFVSTAATVSAVNCRLVSNRAGNSGQSGDFMGNEHIPGGPGGSGGAIYCDSVGSLEITRCEVAGNASGDAARGSLARLVTDGGCRAAMLDVPELGERGATDGCGGDGGGLFINETSGDVSDCEIVNNAAGNAGGCEGWSICVGGRGGRGGGVLIAGATSTVDLVGCLIVQNVAGDSGSSGSYGGHAGDAGGLRHEGAGVVANCTIADNSAGNVPVVGGDPPVSGGLQLATGSAVEVHGDVVWSNSAAGGTTEQRQIDGVPALIGHSCVQGWTGSLGGIGNTGSDPAFTGPGDYHLSGGSLCIDAGDNAFVGVAALDLDGQPRRADDPATPDCPATGCGDAPIVDMGAYEFDPAVPSIGLSGIAYEYSGAVGGANPPEQTLAVRNAGGGTLNWEISGQPAWLTVSPTSGASSGEADTVTLSVDTSSLAHGAYAALLVVGDPQALNSPRQVAIALYVNETLQVPSAHTTIQAAIDAAVRGDEVVVANGTYTGAGNKDLDLAGKAIILRSESGDPSLCILDCQDNGRGFYFHNRETAATIIEGFTIADGNVGGISPGGNFGGGVYCGEHAHPVLTKCVISGCQAFYGGGVYCYDSVPTFIQCVVTGNSSYHHGGGIFSDRSAGTFTRCRITGNSASIGGGVQCTADRLEFTDCLIAGNSAQSIGGVRFEGSSTVMTGCTISANSANNDSGGVYSSGYSTPPTLGNCIVWGNSPQDYVADGHEPIVTHCDIPNGPVGTGNIDADPVFADPNNDDYHLTIGSPCSDAGDNAYVSPNELDLDGHERRIDDPATPDCQWAPGTCGAAPIVDMGAYEYSAPPACDGDVNCDGRVDFGDVNPFVDALLNATYCDTTGANADVNGNGSVGFEDINPFVNLLTTSTLPVVCP